MNKTSHDHSRLSWTMHPLSLSQMTNLGLFFTDDDFEFDENGREFLQQDRKHCGKRRYCSLTAISPFPTVFSKEIYC